MTSPDTQTSSDIRIPAQRRARTRTRSQTTASLLRELGSSKPIISLGFDRAEFEDLQTIRSIVALSLHFIVSRVTGPVDPDSAVLCVSEVAANAIEHGSGLAYIDIRATLGAFAISVGDRGTSEKARQSDRRSSPNDESGRGLEIVDALSTVWGTDAHETWFVMMSEALEPYPQQSEHPSRHMADIGM